MCTVLIIPIKEENIENQTGKKYDSENVCLKKRKIMQLNMEMHRFNYPH